MGIESYSQTLGTASVVMMLKHGVKVLYTDIHEPLKPPAALIVKHFLCVCVCVNDAGVQEARKQQLYHSKVQF